MRRLCYYKNKDWKTEILFETRLFTYRLYRGNFENLSGVNNIGAEIVESFDFRVSSAVIKIFVSNFQEGFIFGNGMSY